MIPNDFELEPLIVFPSRSSSLGQPDYRRRRPEHLWLPKEAEDAVIGRRNLARYYFDLRGFEAVVADDSSWIRDPQYQAPNGSRSSVLLSGGSKHKNKKKKTKKQKHDNKQGSEESEPMKRKRNDVDDPSDFLTLVNYIWGPLAADAFRYQAEEIVRNYEVWDPEAESGWFHKLHTHLSNSFTKQTERPVAFFCDPGCHATQNS